MTLFEKRFLRTRAGEIPARLSGLTTAWDVELPPNSTGNSVDTVAGTGSKARQVAALGSPTTAANMAEVDGSGALRVAEIEGWGIAHTPAAAAQATITRSAGAAGVKHVARSISFSFVPDGTNVQATALHVNLRDGVSGAGTVLWSMTVAAPLTGSPSVFFSVPVNIAGGAATAMTLEFSAAGATGSFESVALSGYDQAA